MAKSFGNTLVPSDEEFDQMRMVGDPIADDLLIKGKELKLSHKELEEDLMETVLQKVVGDHDNNIIKLQAMLERMEKARPFFNKYFPWTAIILLCGSLPTAYSAAKGAETLRCTGRMGKEPKLRVFETTQYLSSLMEHSYYATPKENLTIDELSSLIKGHPGFRATIQVRLLHARVRYHILSSYRHHHGYDVETNGIPINQEDMYGTQLVFSYLVLRGLQTLGFSVTYEEKEDYCYFWSQIGYWIGVQYRSSSFEEEKNLFEYGFKRNFHPSCYSKSIVEQLFRKMVPPNCGEQVEERALLSLGTMCSLLDKRIARSLDLKTSFYYTLRWKLYIQISKLFAVVNSLFKRICGRDIFNCDTILNNISSKAIENMRKEKGLEPLKEMYAFRVV